MIDELLALWQETRSEEVAALLEQVAAGRAPITGHSQRALHESWMEIAAANDPLDLERLLAALANGNSTQVIQRLRHLANRKPDPRVAAAIEGVLANPPSAAYVKSNAIAMWDAMFELLAVVADPRTRTIHERLAWLAHDRAPSPFDVGTLRSRTTTRVAKVAQSIAPAPALTEEQRARISALRVPKRSDRGGDLLEYIYEHPHDLDARSVYADWLTSHGDPRGELIALQLARPLPTTRPWQWYDRKIPAREERLLRTHEKSWVGRLGSVLEHIRFERGFPAWGFLAGDVASLAIPEASTLFHLAVRGNDFATGRRLTERPFHGLTSVSSLGWKTLAGVLDQPSAIRAVEIAAELPEDLSCLDRDVSLDLVDLDFGHSTSAPPATERVRALLRTRIVSRLPTLSVGPNIRNDEAFVEGFVTSSIGTLEFWGYEEKVSIERRTDGFRIKRDTSQRGERALVALRALGVVVDE